MLIRKNAAGIVGVIRSLRGLVVEVEILAQRPENKELLVVDDYPEILLEVSFFEPIALSVSTY